MIEMKLHGHRQLLAQKPWLLAVLGGASFTCGLIVISFSRALTSSSNPSFCSLTNAETSAEAAAISTDYATTPTQLLAILHYATSRAVPQLSTAEIRTAFDVLKELSPCNLLIFGVGYDSLLWAALNARGNTLFLEEDPKWLHNVLQHAPILRAHYVIYPTRLHQANELLQSYKQEQDCWPHQVRLKGNVRCKLALNELPEEVYDKEWDLILIDAPKGFQDAAPGRMGAIFSAAVMARARKNWGLTHVFLHDVNRKVERVYAQEFLCRKYLVNSVGRFWHFAIPPAANVTHLGGDSSYKFC